jgi:hypothetical protein
VRHFDRRIKNIESSMKYIIISLLLLTSSILFSQSNEDILKFSYGMAKDFQIGSSEKVKSVEFNPQKVFIKSKYSKDTLFSVLDFFEKDIKVTVNQKDETRVNIILESNFPSYFQEELFSVVKFKSRTSNLLNSKNKQVEIFKNFPFSTSGKIREGSNSEFEYRTLESKTTLKNNDLNLKGTIAYELSILTDYSILKLNLNDIGKTIQLNNLNYKVVNIIKNKIVLKKLYPSKYEGNIKLLLFDKENNLIVSDTGNQNLHSLHWTATFDSTYYNFISKNKDYTFEEFNQQIKYENVIPDNPDYILIAGLADIENEFILYESEYNVSKIIEVKIK